jgi:hypothetical protein
MLLMIPLLQALPVDEWLRVAGGVICYHSTTYMYVLSLQKMWPQEWSEYPHDALSFTNSREDRAVRATKQIACGCIATPPFSCWYLHVHILGTATIDYSIE